MDYLEYLFAGFAVFWAGLFVYLLWLQVRLRALRQELERLEERLADYEEDAATARAPARGDTIPPPITTSSTSPQRTAE